jgi:lauroyl/myristoyl acyltransferase
MRLELKFVTPYDIYLLCVIALIKVVDRSASPLLGRFFARTAALAAWRLSRRRRRSRSLSLARTLAVSEAEIPQIVKNCFYEFWYGVFSLPCHGGRRSMRVELRGLENLHNAIAKGKGVILWESNSFGKRVLAKRILHGNGVSVSQVHGQHHLEGFHNSKSWIAMKVIRPFFENCERPFVKEIIYLPDSEFPFNRTFLERLKRNGILCIAADGRQGHKFILVRFLGHSAFFSTGMVSLAKLSGATILPLFCIQQDTEKAAVIIEAPIQIDVNGDRERGLERSVRQYAGLLESYIRRYPEQYLSWRPSPDHESAHNEALWTERSYRSKGSRVQS